jgi:hypothetical protein
LSELLKSIGNRSRNSVLAVEDLVDEQWKEPAKKLWKSLIGELPSNGWENLEELVIIPDGVLWYLPFEVLQVPADQIEESDADVSLIEQTRIRYAPVAALSVADQRGHEADQQTTVVGGQLFPRESSEYAGEMLTKLREAFPDLVVVGKRKPIKPSRYTAGLFDRLIVWNDVNVQSKSPYGWAPAQYDRDGKDSSLADWMEYPWGAPDQIIIPGFHTAAEATLSAKSTGHEVFLAACGLMSTGTRTALLSRWRTGGKSPSVLVREFAIELKRNGASDAWRTAVELTRVETLDAKVEPRVRKPNEDMDLSADHPFFWAGYMLLDTGAEPERPAAAEGAEPQNDDKPADGEVVDENDDDNPPDEPTSTNETDVEVELGVE